MDADFWDEILQRLEYSDLEWLEIRIRRRKTSMHPERTARRALIKNRETENGNTKNATTVDLNGKLITRLRNSYAEYAVL